MTKDKVRIMIYEPGKPGREEKIEDSLKAMQAVVEGDIEVVAPFPGRHILLVCNEMGKLTGKPRNRPLKDVKTGEFVDVVCGTFFCCSEKDGELANLTDEDVAFLKEEFR